MNHAAPLTRTARILATLFAAVMSVVALSGTAFAYHEPIRPQSGTIKSGSTIETVVTRTVSVGWTPLAVVAVAVVALLIGWVASAGLARVRGTRAGSPALSS